jgi:hypothetical protein
MNHYIHGGATVPSEGASGPHEGASAPGEGRSGPREGARSPGGGAPGPREGSAPPVYRALNASSTCSSCPSTLTFFQILRTLPLPSITKVERWMPIEVLPYRFFSRQAP